MAWYAVAAAAVGIVSGIVSLAKDLRNGLDIEDIYNKLD